MRYFKNPEDGKVYAYDLDCDDSYIKPGLIQITATEFNEYIDNLADVVPHSVSRFKARAAMLKTPSKNSQYANVLEEVEAIMSAPGIDPVTAMAWREVTEFRRESPAILAIADQIGLSSEELDAIFILAASIPEP